MAGCTVQYEDGSSTAEDDLLQVTGGNTLQMARVMDYQQIITVINHILYCSIHSRYYTYRQ